ncbi:MAG: hypothetical protein K9N51_01015 [Candidatus Pacebacteria bacterium]|nr:hypothetical protein [Candidatus Paceibacterota bacterium]
MNHIHTYCAGGWLLLCTLFIMLSQTAFAQQADDERLEPYRGALEERQTEGEEGTRLPKPTVRPYQEHLEADELVTQDEAAQEAEEDEQPRQAADIDRRILDARRQKATFVEEARRKTKERLEQAREKKSQFIEETQELPTASYEGMPARTRGILRAMARETIQYYNRIARLKRAKQVMQDKEHYALAQRLDSMLAFETGMYKVRMRKLQQLDAAAAKAFDPEPYKRAVAESDARPGIDVHEMIGPSNQPTVAFIAKLMTKEEMKRQRSAATRMKTEELIDLGENDDTPSPSGTLENGD